MNENSLVCKKNILVLVAHPDDAESFRAVRLLKGKSSRCHESLLYKKRRSSTQFAIQALLSHPLVLSFTRATRLIDKYLKAHAAYVGKWN